jgi:DNA-binding IclR family transcriptional regulator
MHRISKTLHNGLRILELLAARAGGATIAEIAEAIEAEWSVAQRLVVTLQYHDLVRRDDQKRIHLGPGLVALAEPIERDWRVVAGPILQRLADALHATANLVIVERGSQVRALIVVEPTAAPAHIAFRAGQVHPINQGASGLAILASRPPSPGERPEVAEARERGYAVTCGEVIPFVTGVATPVPTGSGPSTMSLGVSLLTVSDLDETGKQVIAAAAELASMLPAGVPD